MYALVNDQIVRPQQQTIEGWTSALAPTISVKNLFSNPFVFGAAVIALIYFITCSKAFCLPSILKFVWKSILRQG
jgi:hypothetical protein